MLPINKSICVILGFGLFFLLLWAVPLAAFEAEFFPDYFSAFRFLAEKSHLSSDDKSVFKLAAESSIEKFAFGEELLVVVSLDYYAGLYSSIRSPEGNGHFHVFLACDDLLEYLGPMEGAGYRLEEADGGLSFVGSWIISKNEAIESTYKYEEGRLRLVSKILYEYEPDGSKVKVREYK